MAMSALARALCGEVDAQADPIDRTQVEAVGVDSVSATGIQVTCWSPESRTRLSRVDDCGRVVGLGVVWLSKRAPG
jgi:hypothetical protein